MLTWFEYVRRRACIQPDLQVAIVSLPSFVWKCRETAFRLPHLTSFLLEIYLGRWDLISMSMVKIRGGRESCTA